MLTHWFSKNKAFSYISLAKQNNRTLLALRFWGKKENFSPRCRINLRRSKLFFYISLAKQNNRTLLAFRFWGQKKFSALADALIFEEQSFFLHLTSKKKCRSFDFYRKPRSCFHFHEKGRFSKCSGRLRTVRFERWKKLPCFWYRKVCHFCYGLT